MLFLLSNSCFINDISNFEVNFNIILLWNLLSSIISINIPNKIPTNVPEIMIPVINNDFLPLSNLIL